MHFTFERAKNLMLSLERKLDSWSEFKFRLPHWIVYALFLILVILLFLSIPYVARIQ
jgi:hypothetical protein